MMKLLIHSIYAPFLFRAPISGQLYVIGNGWHEVPEGTTLEQVEWVNTMPKVLKKSEPKADVLEVVKSSTGKGEYTVTFMNNQWSCTCTGYGFRRKCKHIDKIQAKYGSKK